MTFPLMETGAFGKFEIRYKCLLLKALYIPELGQLWWQLLHHSIILIFFLSVGNLEGKDFKLSFSQEEKALNCKPLYPRAWKTFLPTKHCYPTPAPSFSRLFEGEGSGHTSLAVSD